MSIPIIIFSLACIGWLIGSAVAYGAHIYVMTTCEPYKSLNSPVNHFNQFELLWFLHFEDEWRFVSRTRTEQYLMTVGISLLGSWMLADIIRRQYKKVKGFQWRLSKMPDKHQFKTMVLQKKFSDPMWKDLVSVMEGGHLINEN